MEAALKKRVIGQDEAIEKIAHAIQVHRAGLTDPTQAHWLISIFGTNRCWKN